MARATVAARLPIFVARVLPGGKTGSSLLCSHRSMGELQWTTFEPGVSGINFQSAAD
jgi:hypothetical protein